MKVAILGVGSIAATHVENLTSLGHEIVMAVGRDLSKTKKFADRWNIKKYSIDYRDAFSPDIDVVHICTPPTLHYEMAKGALNAGKHVVCEKPLCIDPKEAKELMELAKKVGTVNAVNFNVRFHDACRQIKDIVSSEDFGQIHLIHGSYLQEFHILPTNYMWRYIEDLGGAMRATTEIGSHWIDLVRYLSGLEIVEVNANFAGFNPVRYVKDGVMYDTEREGSEKIEVNSEDATAVLLKFSNGAIGTMLLSEISHGRKNKLSVEISSSESNIWWDSEDHHIINQGTRNKGTRVDVNPFASGFANTFKNSFSEIYKEIEEGKPSNCPNYPVFKDGYINAAVCDAICKSAKNNSIWMEVESDENE